MVRRAMTTATSAALIICMLLTLAGSGRTVYAQHARCAYYSYGATEDCYAVSAVTQAESQLAMPPIDPSSAVWTAARLRLTSIIVWHPSLHPEPVSGITYVFGTIPLTWGGSIPQPVASHPRILLVYEDSSFRPAGPWRVARTEGGLVNGKRLRGPWYFHARHLDMDGNVSKQVMQRVGLSILKQAGH